MVGGRWSVVGGQRLEVSGQWSVVSTWGALVVSSQYHLAVAGGSFALTIDDCQLPIAEWNQPSIIKRQLTM